MESELAGRYSRSEHEGTEDRATAYEAWARVALDVRVEDRLVLRPSVVTTWREQRAKGEMERYERWLTWGYALIVVYRLDGALF